MFLRSRNIDTASSLRIHVSWKNQFHAERNIKVLLSGFIV